MQLFTLVYTLFVFPILYCNAACCHRRGSVHGLSVGGSICHDRGTRLGTRNRVLDGRSRFPMRMGNFEEKKGRPIRRRTYDCTVPIGLRQPLSGPFISLLEKCNLRLVSRFLFLLGTRRSQYEARGANSLKMSALHETAVIRSFFQPKMKKYRWASGLRADPLGELRVLPQNP